MKHFMKKYRLDLILVLLFAVYALFLSVSGVLSFSRMKVEGIDPVCYYSYLRSVVFDGDLDFENEYQRLESTGTLLSYDRTQTGRMSNTFSAGPAIAVSPFFLVAHFLVKITNIAPADGFSQPYHVSVFIGLAFYALAGLLLLKRWLALYFNEWTAFTAAMVTWFASSAVYYAWPLTFMPHAISLFFVLLFLFYAEKSRYKESWKRWAVLGVLAGAMALMRWQNLIFILFIFPDVWKTWKEKSPAAVLKNQFLPGFLFSLLIFLPQVIAWFILYGRPFTVPQGRGFLIWSRPEIFSILFSTFNGLFTWTPVTLFGIAGIVVWIVKKKEKTVPVALLVIFLFQLYLNSIVRDWHGSWGFGMRRFVNCLPVFALGAGYLVMLLRKKVDKILTFSAVALFIVWNGLFLVQYYLHLVAWNRPLTFHEMVTDKLHIMTSINRRRFVKTAYSSARKGYYDDVEKALKIATDLDPSHADIYFAAAQIAESQGNYESALKLYRIASEFAPGDPDIPKAVKKMRRLLNPESRP